MNGKWILALAVAAFLLSEDFKPARFTSGDVPAQPVQTLGGGEVLLELEVDASGTVASVVTLRSTPPFTELLREKVARWRFEPATEKKGPVESKVLVAGWFRPPTLFRGAMPGAAPRDVRAPSPELPFPRSTSTPPYPPRALGNRVVLVEVEVGEAGQVAEARVVRSATGFDVASLKAARQWKFRPARREGAPSVALAYIVFGFREPVTGGSFP
ncbi:MAG: TonB family protein [Acidobacteriota bacterium]